FIVWASATWGVGAQPTVGEVREAYNTFFAGATSGNTDLQTAMAQIAASTDTDDADGTQLALALVHGAQSAYDARYEVFRADLITFGSQAARADTFADDVSAAIRTENQRVIDNIPDRHYTDLRVFNWGGTVLVIIGESHDLNKLGSPDYDYWGYIAKRSATIG